MLNCEVVISTLVAIFFRINTKNIQLFQEQISFVMHHSLYKNITAAASHIINIISKARTMVMLIFFVMVFSWQIELFINKGSLYKKLNSFYKIVTIVIFSSIDF